MKKAILIGVICFIGGMYHERLMNKSNSSKNSISSPIIELYKDSINDMRKQAKLDRKISESEVRDSIITTWRPIERKAIKSDTGRVNKIKRFMEINYRK